MDRLEANGESMWMIDKGKGMVLWQPKEHKGTGETMYGNMVMETWWNDKEPWQW